MPIEKVDDGFVCLLDFRATLVLSCLVKVTFGCGNGLGKVLVDVLDGHGWYGCEVATSTLS